MSDESSHSNKDEARPVKAAYGRLTYGGASIAGLGLLGFVGGELFAWQIMYRTQGDTSSAIRAAFDGTADTLATLGAFIQLSIGIGVIGAFILLLGFIADASKRSGTT